MDDCEGHIHVQIPISIDFWMIGREDPHRTEVKIDYVVEEGFEPGTFDVGELMEHVSDYMSQMFDTRSAHRAVFDSTDHTIYGVTLSEVQAFTINPISIEAIDRLIEETANE